MMRFYSSKLSDETKKELIRQSNMHGFTLEELKALYRTLEYQWINRKDEEAMEVINKISKILEEERCRGSKI